MARNKNQNQDFENIDQMEGVKGGRAGGKSGQFEDYSSDEVNNSDMGEKTTEDVTDI